MYSRRMLFIMTVMFMVLMIVLVVIDLRQYDHIYDMMRTEETYSDEQIEVLRENTSTTVILTIIAISTVFIVLFVLVKKAFDKEIERSQSNNVFNDELTGVFSKQYFSEHIDALINGCREDDYVAGLFIDIDNLDKVNTKDGKAAGDEVLSHMARYIQKTLLSYPYDNIIVPKKNIICRYREDEFFAALACIRDAEEMEQVCQGLLGGLKGLKTSKYITKHKISFSIGAVLYKKIECDEDSLVNSATEAMHEAKAKNKNDYVSVDYTT